MTILSQIYDNKEVLFGLFSDKLTHDDKINKWKEIAETLRALGILKKDWKSLRDTIWQNWRKITMEKRDNRLQTGSGGGKKCKYDECDEMVLKSIRKNSPVIDGLIVPESSGTNEATVNVPVASMSTIEDLPAPAEAPLTPAQPSRNPKRKSFSSPISISEADLPDELMDLKTQKIKIEIDLSKEKLEIAKREKYKLDLEILKLERDLKIHQPSTFTSPFYLQNVVFEKDNQENGDILQKAKL